MCGNHKCLSFRVPKGKQPIGYFIEECSELPDLCSIQFLEQFHNQCCQDLDRLSADSYCVLPRTEVSPMVEESKKKCEFRAFCSDAVVVGRDGELAA